MLARSSYYHDPEGRKRRQREKRIDELMAEAGDEGRALGRIYWEMVHDNEQAPLTTDLEQLAAAGFEFPPADALDGEALVAKLRELRHELDRMGVNLFGAEHVPAQVLYHLLVSDLLRQEREDIPVPPGGAWIIDVSLRFEDLAGECPVQDLSLRPTD